MAQQGVLESGCTPGRAPGCRLVLQAPDLVHPGSVQGFGRPKKRDELVEDLSLLWCFEPDKRSNRSPPESPQFLRRVSDRQR